MTIVSSKIKQEQRNILRISLAVQRAHAWLCHTIKIVKLKTKPRTFKEFDGCNYVDCVEYSNEESGSGHGGCSPKSWGKKRWKQGDGVRWGRLTEQEAGHNGVSDNSVQASGGDTCQSEKWRSAGMRRGMTTP